MTEQTATENPETTCVKVLWLIRHAKSAHPFGVADMDRPLSNRGLNDCSIMGQAIAQTQRIPKLIVASDSLRTRQTADRLNEEFNAKLVLDHVLYMADEDDVLDLVFSLDDSMPCCALVTHLPTLQDCMWESRKGWTENALPTLASVCLEHAGAWTDFDLCEADCKYVLKPKQYRKH